MSEQQILEEKYRKRESRSIGKSVTKSIAESDHKRKITIGLTVVLWVLLVVGGYLMANQYVQDTQKYIDQRLDRIEETNQEQIQQVESQLQSVQDEISNIHQGLAYIDEELKLTGKTIGGSDKTKQALQQRIDQLNTQLVELKASLKKLEEATRAY